MSKSRRNLALTLLTMAIVLNLIVLFTEDTSPGWPIAAVVFLGAAGATLFAERREP